VAAGEGGGRASCWAARRWRSWVADVGGGSTLRGTESALFSAASAAAENKALSVPRSVDSLPTSANQEDHVSMATNAALRLAPMATNTAAIVAIELLAAAQGVELRAPLSTSPRLQGALELVRREAAFWD